MSLPHPIVEPARRPVRSLPRRAGIAGALVLGLTGGGLGSGNLAPPAFAQAPAKPAPGGTPSGTAPVSAEPGATTATYGDWVLRCQRLGGESPQRVCEIGQAMQVQGQAAPVAQLAIGRLPGQDGLRVTVLLPANVALPSSVRVGEAKEAGGDKAKDTGRNPKEADHGLDLDWWRCLPSGCLADTIISEPILQRWRKAEEAGRIGFRDAEGREVAVPLSFRGLGPALDALAKEKP